MLEKREAEQAVPGSRITGVYSPSRSVSDGPQGARDFIDTNLFYFVFQCLALSFEPAYSSLATLCSWVSSGCVDWTVGLEQIPWSPWPLGICAYYAQEMARGELELRKL